jgi:hypothetical protein
VRHARVVGHADVVLAGAAVLGAVLKVALLLPQRVVLLLIGGEVLLEDAQLNLRAVLLGRHAHLLVVGATQTVLLRHGGLVARLHRGDHLDGRLLERRFERLDLRV